MDEMEMNIENISLVCRVCLGSDNLEPSITSQQLIIYEKITELKIDSNDKLPQTICAACSSVLKDISDFIETCKLSDKYLKTLIDDRNVKDESDNYQRNDDLSSDNEVNDGFLKENTSFPIDDNNENFEDSVDNSQLAIKPFSCDICGRRFVRCIALKRHKEMHDDIFYKCKSCDKKFRQKSALWKHLLTHRDENRVFVKREGEVSVVLSDKVTIPSNSKSEIVTCESEQDFIKNESVASKKECKNGSNILEKQKNSNIELEIEEADLENKGDNESEGKSHQTKKKRLELCLCSLCGKQFKRYEFLRNHMAIHMNVKPYTCNICGTGFTQRQALSRHNLVHTKVRPHKCTYCEKTFIRKEKLTDHVRCHEEGVPPHLCFHCGRRFKDREYLRKHLQYHLHGGKTRWRSNSKSCLCPECGKEFHSESYLKRHVNSHSGVKPFTCEICKKSFSVNAGLEYHMKIHKGLKPFKCTHEPCNKAFRSTSALKIHERMHSNERPFRCNICCKGFIRNSHLKRHLKLHTNNIESTCVKEEF